MHAVYCVLFPRNVVVFVTYRGFLINERTNIMGEIGGGTVFAFAGIQVGNLYV